MSPRVFIINVGVNASHGSLRSPLFEDGSFVFVPIPETVKCPDSDLVPTYREALPYALPYIPECCHTAKVHNDPEFETLTYGDFPETRGRAAALKHMEPGDYLCFLAPLVRWSGIGAGFTKEAGFYIVGYFQVAEVIKGVTDATPLSVLRRIRHSAHVKLAMCGVGGKGFWVIRGSPQSQLLPCAMPFDRELADRVMRDRRGRPWKWREDQSVLQTIGSYTRSCRMITGQAKTELLLDRIGRHATGA
jgi:hypothetical protein